MAKTKTLVQTESLSELLSAINSFYESDEQLEPTNTEVSLSVYASDLVPDKVDAVAKYIDREKFAVEAEEQYAKELVRQAKLRKERYEKLKKYFAHILFSHDYDSSNKLRGNTAAIWFSKTKVVDEEGDIPDEFKKTTYVIAFTEEAFKLLPEEVKTNALSIEVDTVIDKIGIKEKDKTQPLSCVVENYHLKIGKSNSKDEEAD